METIIGKILGDLGTFLFGPIMLAVFFGVGLYFTIRLKGIQFTRFGTAFREVVLNVEKKSDEGIGQIRSYKALATALSSCVGNGNIVGVAYAIAGCGLRLWAVWRQSFRRLPLLCITAYRMRMATIAAASCTF